MVKQMGIKFELGSGSNHPHVPVMLNGSGPFTFTLDTGATATTISKALAEKLGIEIYEGDKAMASGVGGVRFPVAFAKTEKLQIGDEIIENEEMMVIDFDSLFEGACFMPGVIGHTTLKRYEISVNYPAKTLELRKSNGSQRKTNDVDWYDFEYLEETHLIGVPTFLNGIGPFHMVLDTGSGGNVITPKAAEKIGISKAQSATEIKVKSLGSSGCEEGCQGVGGFAQGYAIQLESLAIGNVTMENPTVGVIDLKVISPRGDVIQDGIIGFPFLKDMELVIDYPNKKLAFLKCPQNN